MLVAPPPFSLSEVEGYALPPAINKKGDGAKSPAALRILKPENRDQIMPSAFIYTSRIASSS